MRRTPAVPGQETLESQLDLEQEETHVAQGRKSSDTSDTVVHAPPTAAAAADVDVPALSEVASMGTKEGTGAVKVSAYLRAGF